MEQIDLPKRGKEHWDRLCYENVTITYCNRLNTEECPQTCKYYEEKNEQRTTD